LLLASEKGHLEVVKCLLANGANKGDKNRVRLYQLHTSSCTYYALHYLYDTTLQLSLWDRLIVLFDQYYFEYNLCDVL